MKTTIAMKRNRVSADLSSPGPAKVSKPDHEREGRLRKVSDVSTALHYLQSLFKSEAFQSDPPLPPIVLKHQFYSLLQNRTDVDRELVSLRDRGCIRIFKLGMSEQDYAVVDETTYCSYLREFLKDDLLAQKLLQDILPQCKAVSITREQLIGELGMKKEQVSALVRHGVFLVKDVGKTNSSWWLAIPGISPFIKSLIKGRSMIQQIFQRSKFNELLQGELVSRKLHVTKLTMEYHIHDLVGSDQVESINTTCGPLLRLIKDKYTH